MEVGRQQISCSWIEQWVKNIGKGLGLHCVEMWLQQEECYGLGICQGSDFRQGLMLLGRYDILIVPVVQVIWCNCNLLKLQELIGLIRHTKIPIICMCNDRNHPKMRSLVHYCLDLRFQRPRLEQIKVSRLWLYGLHWITISNFSCHVAECIQNWICHLMDHLSA